MPTKKLSSTRSLNLIYLGLRAPSLALRATCPKLDSTLDQANAAMTPLDTRVNSHIPVVAGGFSPSELTWVRQLKRGLKADPACREGPSEGILSEHGVSALRGMAQASSLCGFAQLTAMPDAADVIEAHTKHLIVLVGSKSQKAIGFCTFGLNWYAPASPCHYFGTELELSLTDAWIVPNLRGQHLSQHFATCVASILFSHLAAVEAAVPPARRQSEQFKLTVAGAVRSEQGALFLASTFAAVKQQLKQRQGAAVGAQLVAKGLRCLAHAEPACLG